MSSKNKYLLLLATLTPLFLSGVVFYLLQNKNLLPGGNIALSKIFWLCLVIFYWYIAPALLLSSKFKCVSDLILIKIHLVNVWLRAIIELFMMYISKNWSPYYGITHDVLSFFLLGGLLYFYRKNLSKETSRLFSVLIAIFSIETYFAYYMLKSVPAESSIIYFVPQSADHNQILVITWMVVILLLIYMLNFVSAWLYPDASTNNK